MTENRPSLADYAAAAAAHAATPENLACPRCGCRHLLAGKTFQQTSRIVRYRRCRNCGHSVLTKQQQPREEIIRDVAPRATAPDNKPRKSKAAPKAKKKANPPPATAPPPSPPEAVNESSQADGFQFW